MNYFVGISYAKKKELIKHYLFNSYTIIDENYNIKTCGYILKFNNNICLLCEKQINKQYKVNIYPNKIIKQPTKNKFKICQECLRIIDTLYFNEKVYSYQFNHNIAEFLFFKEKWMSIILCLKNELCYDVILTIMSCYVNNINMFN